MKTNMYHKFILCLIYSIFIGFIPISKAVAEDANSPQIAIEAASNKLQKKMQDPTFTKDFKQITEFVESVIYTSVDFDRISALVLGKHWKNATDDEKVRFKTAFQTLLIRTYSRAFIEFKEWSVRFLPLNMEAGAKKVIVKTEILQPSVQPIGVNYRMFLSKGEWKAYDIIIEGISLVTNYRTSFKNEIIKNGSLDETIKALITRNDTALEKK